MRPLTHAEEQADRLNGEKAAGWHPTHTYSPIGWDQFDPRGVQGRQIRPGAPVQLLREHTKVLHQGMPGSAKSMFHVVRDADGNVQHVHRDSLGRLGKV